MKGRLQVLHQIYHWLLRFYLRNYREEYGKELQSVFNLSLKDAMNTGRMEVVWVILRELIGLPTAILYEHLRKPKYGLVAQTSIFAKDDYMKTIRDIRWGLVTLASLLPLWLLYLGSVGSYRSCTRPCHQHSFALERLAGD